jgi:hypothetical protein
LGRLAQASEVTGGHAIKCFKIGRSCHFKNGKVCPPATSEAGARRQLEQYFMSYLSIYFCCSTLVNPVLVRPWKDHFKSDLRSDQDHRQENDLRSDQEDHLF